MGLTNEPLELTCELGKGPLAYACLGKAALWDLYVSYVGYVGLCLKKMKGTVIKTHMAKTKDWK